MPSFRIRDRTNEQSLAQYQAYQQQQAQIQAQFLQSQAQQNPHPFANDATMVSPSVSTVTSHCDNSVTVLYCRILSIEW